jgi:hypothetical protein
MRKASLRCVGGRCRWYATVVIAVAVLAGCQPVGDAAVADPGIVGMGCEQSATFLFSGETSLAAIGLGEEMFGRDAQRVGMVWVTAEPVNMMGPGPLPAGMEPEFQRMVCVQFPDGSGMAGPIPPDWEPPSAFDVGASAEDGGPPFVLIGLVVAAALIGGVSFLAFRGDPH